MGLVVWGVFVTFRESHRLWDLPSSHRRLRRLRLFRRHFSWVQSPIVTAATTRRRTALFGGSSHEAGRGAWRERERSVVAARQMLRRYVAPDEQELPLFGQCRGARHSGAPMLRRYATTSACLLWIATLSAVLPPLQGRS